MPCIKYHDIKWYDVIWLYTILFLSTARFQIDKYSKTESIWHFWILSQKLWELLLAAPNSCKPAACVSCQMPDESQNKTCFAEFSS